MFRRVEKFEEVEERGEGHTKLSLGYVYAQRKGQRFEFSQNSHVVLE